MDVPLRKRLSSGAPLIVGWCTLPGAAYASALGRTAFEAVCLDQQHGVITLADVYPMLPALHAQSKYALVRAAWNEPGLLGQLLDAGADAVIVPMINTPDDAAALVRATKYPPIGERSFGAYAATHQAGLSRDAYLRAANDLTLSIAMIETGTALSNLDAILSTPGVDAVFVGPTDLTISLTGGSSLDADGLETREALALVARAAAAHRKPAGVFGASPPFAKAALAMGFSFTTSGSDTGLLAAGAANYIESLNR